MKSRKTGAALARYARGSDFEVLGVFEDGLSLLEAASPIGPDVVVADISMPLITRCRSF